MMRLNSRKEGTLLFFPFNDSGTNCISGSKRSVTLQQHQQRTNSRTKCTRAGSRERTCARARISWTLECASYATSTTTGGPRTTVWMIPSSSEVVRGPRASVTPTTGLPACYSLPSRTIPCINHSRNPSHRCLQRAEQKANRDSCFSSRTLVSTAWHAATVDVEISTIILFKQQ